MPTSWSLKVTVLFPSALENVITATNANKIKAKLSCELAKWTDPHRADDILHENGVFVLPDIVSGHAGGCDRFVL